METRDGNQMLRRKFPLAMETTIESKNGRGVKPKVGRSRPQKEGKGRKGGGKASEAVFIAILSSSSAST